MKNWSSREIKTCTLCCGPWAKEDLWGHSKGVENLMKEWKLPLFSDETVVRNSKELVVVRSKGFGSTAVLGMAQIAQHSSTSSNPTCSPAQTGQRCLSQSGRGSRMTSQLSVLSSRCGYKEKWRKWGREDLRKTLWRTKRERSQEAWQKKRKKKVMSEGEGILLREYEEKKNNLRNTTERESLQCRGCLIPWKYGPENLRLFVPSPCCYLPVLWSPSLPLVCTSIFSLVWNAKMLTVNALRFLHAQRIFSHPVPH